jgi:hypothetical protein
MEAMSTDCEEIIRRHEDDLEELSESELPVNWVATVLLQSVTDSTAEEGGSD